MTTTFPEPGFPSPDELMRLPQRAIVVLALRCAKRVRPLLELLWADMPLDVPKQIDRALSQAEAMAFAREWKDAYDAGVKYAYEPLQINAPKAAEHVLSAIHSAVVSAFRAVYWKDEVHILFTSEEARAQAWRERIIWTTLQTFHFACEAIRRGIADQDRLSQLGNALTGDYAMVSGSANSGKWSDFATMPEDFFALRTRFDASPSPFSRIVDVSLQVSRELIRRLVHEPQSLPRIPPHIFEQLIAELFHRFGFHVELTSHTQDGGYDIVAISDTLVHRGKYLIECKRYATSRKVGIVPVRALYGLVEAQDATKGILVSTGGFTAPARDFLKQHMWRIEGRDFDDIVGWLRLYDELTMRNSVLPVECRNIGGLPTRPYSRRRGRRG